MRWLILGATGYIGGCLLAYARSRDLPAQGVGSRELDLLDLRLTRAFLADLEPSPTAVIVLSVKNKATSDHLEGLIENQRMMANLASGLSQMPQLACLVYLSSADVYGAHPRLPIDEDTPLNPDNWYGLAKSNCEWILQHSGLRCPVSILRIPGVYGRSPRDHSVISRMTLSLKSEGRIRVSGDGSHLRDFLYVGDLPPLVEQLMARGHSGVLTVATGEALSLNATARTILKVLELSGTVEYVPEDPRRAFSLSFNPRRLQELLPEFRFTPLTVGVASYRG